jgi:hypothetical protein
MTKLILTCALVISAVAASGCVTQGDPPRAASETESVATGELTAGAGEPTAAQQICFTCDIEPSVHSCSSIASHAQHVCQRACIVCDVFGDNIGDCFPGLCEPDLP